jgi:hypothetical protein
MSGPNEHYIPQFLQRSFAIPCKGGQPNEIWVYTQATEPEIAPISKTASEDQFYGTELDEKLKGPENKLGLQFAFLRKQTVGSSVDPQLAASLIAHLAPRAKHLRVAIATGFAQLAKGVQELFGNRDNLGAMLGLDGEEPNDQFLKHIRDAIASGPELRAFGLSMPLLERVAFRLAKEQFEPNFRNTACILPR